MAGRNRILVAVDFSPVSTAALKTAIDLAAGLGSKVKVVHVLPVQTAGLPKNADAVYIEDLHMQQKAGAKIQLDEFVERHGRRGFDVDTEVLDGEPKAALLQVCEQPGTGMIVMGTHGHTGLRELLVGSVAEAVLRRARIPVVLVKE